ncbi:MAG: long-chain-fatty-acid--CoA ligase, partial [Cytophagaceae bacterium]
MNTQSTINPYPWRRFYPKGVPDEINPDAYTSLAALLEEGCRRFTDRPAYSCMGKQITFGELDQLSAQFASFLQNDLKLHKGDRIAIQMPNTLQYPIAMFGALRAGLAVVNTNPLYTPREMQHQFKDSGTKAIVILSNFASNLEKILDRTEIQHIVITQLGDLLGFPKKQIVNAVVKYVKKLVPAYNLPDAISFNDALGRGSSQPFKPVPIQNTDLAFVQYTGGTTGVSKGAMLTQGNLCSNAETLQQAWRFTDQDVLLHALPLF